MATPKITYRGKTLLLSEWAEELGISRAAMSSRINEFKFNDRERFLTNLTPAQKKQLLRKRVAVTETQKFAGKTVAQWAALKGCSRQAIYQRLKHVGTRYNSVQEALGL